jgi:alpha-L-rhamnosidase
MRDFIDDEDAWAELTRFAIDNDLAASETHLAQLLAPFSDRSAAEIGDAVWTRVWPSEATKLTLGELVANRLATPTVPTLPLAAQRELAGHV